MQAEATTLGASAAASTVPEVPQWRLHLIRGFCLFFVVAAPFNDLPRLFFHAPDERGMITCILAGLWVMALFGLLIPWRHVWRHYVRAPAERWR